MVFLIAIANDRQALAVWGPTGRTLEDWQALLEWLAEPGISPLRGLVGLTYDGDSAIRGAVQLAWPRVVQQQPVWRILERVAQDVSGVRGPKATEVERVVDRAARIFPRHAGRPDAEKRARVRLTQFALEHSGTAFVQTVSRAFDEGRPTCRPAHPGCSGRMGQQNGRSRSCAGAPRQGMGSRARMALLALPSCGESRRTCSQR